MIGRVTWTQFGREWQAILENNQTWTVPDDPALARLLDTLYSPAALGWGPADGFFGPAQLRDLADKLGGTAHIEPRESPAPVSDPMAERVFKHLGIKPPPGDPGPVY